MLQREPLRRRRKFPPWIPIAFATVAAGIGAVAYARTIEPRTLLVRELEVAIPTLPATLDGVRLGFTSDFHLGGPGNNPAIARQAVDTLAEIRPDIILLGGDYFDEGKLTGPLPDWSRLASVAPTFAVPGNHDYHASESSADEILESLSTAGITVLRNKGVTVPVRDAAIGLIGLDDPYLNRADFDKSARDLDCRITPRIVLTHAGLVADHLPVGAADLIVSGHTHGAQIRFSPFRHTGMLDIFWWLDHLKDKRISPYRQGMFYVRGSLLYVGNGLGMTTLGLRFLAPPEVTLFTLRSSAGNEDYACDDPYRYVLRESTQRVLIQN